MANARALKKMHELLMRAKKWRYLRYLHAREALVLAEGIKSVLVVGAGYGLAELALAAEFEGVQFHLTDWSAATHTLGDARILANTYDLKNISFGQHEVLTDRADNYDMVYSVEVLEHIKEAERAARNMRGAARKFVFCLVPFANSEENADIAKRDHAWAKHEHYVVGFDAKRLQSLFPNPVAIRNCYWRDAGAVLRKRLEAMEREEIKSNMGALMVEANKDVRKNSASAMSEAQGIWILSKCS